jgi:hypothetical protein
MMRTYFDLTAQELDDLEAWAREPGLVSRSSMQEHLQVPATTLTAWVQYIARDRAVDLSAWREAMSRRATHGAAPARSVPRLYRETTAEQRDVLRQAIVSPEGWTMSRVAEGAGCKPSTARAWVHRYAQEHQLDPAAWEAWVASNYDCGKRGKPSHSYQRMLSRIVPAGDAHASTEAMIQRIRDPLCDYLEHEHMTTAAFCVAQNITRRSLDDALHLLQRAGALEDMRRDWRQRVDACIDALRDAHEEQHSAVCSAHRLSRASVYRRWQRVDPSKILPSLDYGDVLWALRDALTIDEVRRWRRAFESLWGWAPGTYTRPSA